MVKNYELEAAFAALGTGLISDDGTGIKQSLLTVYDFLQKRITKEDARQALDDIGCEDVSRRIHVSIATRVMALSEERYGKDFIDLYDKLYQHLFIKDTLPAFAYVMLHGCSNFVNLPIDQRYRNDGLSWYMFSPVKSSCTVYRYFKSRRSSIEVLDTFLFGSTVIQNPMLTQYDVTVMPNNESFTAQLLVDIKELFREPRVPKYTAIFDKVRQEAYRQIGNEQVIDFNTYYIATGCKRKSDILDLYYALLNNLEMLRDIKDQVFDWRKKA